MSRSVYGGAGASQVIDTTGHPKTSPATVYSTRTGGVVVSDIQNLAGGALAGIVTPDSVGYVIFQGPDNFTDTLWLDFGSGPRWAVNPVNNVEVANAAITRVRAADVTTGMYTTPKAKINTNHALPMAEQMAWDLDEIVVPKYASVTARGTANPSPADGDQAYIQDTHVAQVYNANVARWVNRPQLIAEWVAPNNTLNSVTFSSIPQTFRSLLVIYNGRVASAGAIFTPVRIQFNGDTATNYRYAGRIGRQKTISGTTTYEVAEDGTGGNTASATAATYGTLSTFNAATGSPVVGYVPGPTTHASSRGGGSFMVPGYKETGHKWVDAESRWWAHGTTTTDGYAVNLATGGGWTGTAAITSLTVLLGLSGLFSSGTVVSLYGLG